MESRELTAKTVTLEALSYYEGLQEWIVDALHSTDAERELARYRMAAIRVARNELKNA